jgi:glycyl-tRNA synthetase (class II)
VEDAKVIWPLNEIQKGEFKIITNAGPLSAQEIDKIIVHYNLKSPDGNPLSGAKQFNLMVKTHLGPVEDENSVVI